jgi:NAD(P)-dependent dehydrogenase (short-subunit alcohol dehydrogenase family)
MMIHASAVFNSVPWSRPGEMGRSAVFLSSDASSLVTGVELFADGGMAQTG